VLSRSRLRTKLILSYGLVVAIAVVAFATTLISQLGPHLGGTKSIPAVAQYDRRIDNLLAKGLLLGLALSLISSVLAAVLITRFIARPLDHIRAAARYMARGHYDTRVAVPSSPDLAGIATDFNALAARLDDAERHRARLVSDLAHELRTPLTILRGRLDGLADGVFHPSTKLISSMSEDVARLERLTADLSQLSRAEETALHLRPQPLDLVKLTAMVISGVQHRYDENGVAVALTAGQPAPVMADPDRLNQIMVNLLSNALAATDPGGRVTVSISQTSTETTLRVTDTGCGIPSDDLDRIFERFERLSPANRPDPHSGSGIGLTIARAIARSHHGDLFARSNGPGAGAVFTLVLPSRTPSVLEESPV
jgi:signal transduction histidine kinase